MDHGKVDQRPLVGTHVLITRPLHQSKELADGIDELGGESYIFPVIETKPSADEVTLARIKQAVLRVETYDWIVFTSVNGVHFFMEALRHHKIDIRKLHRAAVAAVGRKTAQTLQDYGLFTDIVPASYRAEGLIEALARRCKKGQAMLLPTARIADPALEQALAARGLQVEKLDMYDTLSACPSAAEVQQVLEGLAHGQLQVITFTSSSTVQYFLDVLKTHCSTPPATLLSQTALACIGPKTAATLQKNGLTVSIQAEETSVRGLVEGIRQYVVRHPKTH